MEYKLSRQYRSEKANVEIMRLLAAAHGKTFKWDKGTFISRLVIGELTFTMIRRSFEGQTWISVHRNDKSPGDIIFLGYL